MIPEFWTQLALEILALAGGLLALSLKIENVKCLKSLYNLCKFFWSLKGYYICIILSEYCSLRLRYMISKTSYLSFATCNLAFKTYHINLLESRLDKTKLLPFANLVRLKIFIIGQYSIAQRRTYQQRL